MKALKNKLYLVIFFAMLAQSAFAQKIIPDYDSLAFTKAKRLKTTYEVNQPLVKEIVLVSRAVPKEVKESGSNILGGVAGGALTLFTGIGTNSVTAGKWVSQYELKTHNTKYAWKVSHYFEGELTKNTDRVKNKDGSYSLVSEKILKVNGSKEAIGLIYENEEPIGKFKIERENYLDSVATIWLMQLEAESKPIQAKLKGYEIDQTDFRITGNLRGKEFSVITNGRNFKSLIFIGQVPVAIYQSEPNFTQLSKKKNKITPYLIYPKICEEADKLDLIRLALLQNLLTKSVSVNTYKM